MEQVIVYPPFNSPNTSPTLVESAFPKPSYLPHLNGIRAVALLGVLLFHFEVPHFDGGFIGVDIFLTLSGYLITRNLLNDAANNSLSLRTFYVRRFFRLYPASTVVTLFTLLAAYLLFAPSLASEVCKSAFASQLFSSNIFFYRKANYFETQSLFRPLLHTWSLSLEEHFYFLWAPFLKALLSIPSTTAQFFLMSTLSLTSFVFACYVHHYDYGLMFYLIPGRVYQFTIGAMLAFLQQIQRHSVLHIQCHGLNGDSSTTEKQCFTNNTSEGGVYDARSIPKSWLMLKNQISVSALLLIIASYMLLPKSPSPFLMLPVTIATAVIIQADDTLLSSFLSCYPIVSIGTLTYSAYLVHWPIWVYTRYIVMILDVDGLWRPHPIVATLMTFLVAVLLRQSVEQPFRKGDRRAQILITLLFSVTFGFAIIGLRSDGFSFRHDGADSDAAKLEKFYESNNLAATPMDACTNYTNFLHIGKVDSKVSCDTGLTSVKPAENVLVVGNSFAYMLMPAMDVIGRRRNVRIPLWFAYLCELRARGRIDKVNDYGEYTCKRSVQEIWNRIEKMPSNSTVIFSTYWGLYSQEEACIELGQVQQDLQALGLNGVVIPEPPGIHPRYERFYNCMDSMKLPVGRALRWWGALRKWSQISSCGMNIRQGTEPHPTFSQNEGWYHRCKNLNRLKVLSVSDRICEEIGEDSEFTWAETAKRCKFPVSTVVPTGINDLGYDRDLFHISTYGAYQLADLLDEIIVSYFPEQSGA